MPPMRKPKDNGVIAWLMCMVIRAIIALMQMFPIEWNLETARILAAIWMRLMPRHRKLAEQHIRDSFPEKSEAECRLLSRRCLESTVMFAVEVACMPRQINAFTWSDWIRFRNFDDALRIMANGEGAIMVTGHYGSMELVGHVIAALGFDMVAVMRPFDNVFLNRYLVKARRRNGLELMDKKGAMESSEEVLDRGALLAFIADQDAGRKGIFVDFFGRPASTYKSIALLAMQSRKPIIVGYCRRLDDRARYEIGIERVIRPEEWEAQPDPTRWITETYTHAIESFVREEPSQYLWIHRRWKSVPGQRRKKKPQTV
ncbi:MAG: lysophospholipid acyltransferase family protein [Phycisphaerae bacterium]